MTHVRLRRRTIAGAAALVATAGLQGPSSARGAEATPTMPSSIVTAQPAVPRCEVRTLFQFPLQYDSTTVQPDGRVTFRLCATSAREVSLVSFELDGVPNGFDGKPPGLPMSVDADGYWSATTTVPVRPGVYAYAFRVDGVAAPDPQGSAYSQELRGVRSLLEVRGPATSFHTYDPAIPHGLVAEFRYESSSLKVTRRAHVYLPPGYERGGATRYPVLYLVHGAFDSDESWVTKGRANDVLDGLIAARRAKPMIVVMPAGHTPDRPGVDRLVNTDFGDDLHRDLIPYVDAHFRTIATPNSRAMAGLSMGGAHTLSFGVPRPDVFGAVGVFSIGLLDDAGIAAYRAKNEAGLKARAKAGGPFLFAMGREDGLHRFVPGTRKVFDDYGIRYEYLESGGGHDWRNWRDYLNAFLPTLFR